MNESIIPYNLFGKKINLLISEKSQNKFILRLNFFILLKFLFTKGIIVYYEASPLFFKKIPPDLQSTLFLREKGFLLCTPKVLLNYLILNTSSLLSLVLILFFTLFSLFSPNILFLVFDILFIIAFLMSFIYNYYKNQDEIYFSMHSEADIYALKKDNKSNVLNLIKILNELSIKGYLYESSNQNFGFSERYKRINLQ